MDNISARLNQFQPRMLSIFGCMFGLLVLQHGFSVGFGFPLAGPPNIQLLTMVGIAGVIELIAGSLLVVGLFTRYAAFLVAGLYSRRIPDGGSPTRLYPNWQQRQLDCSLLFRRAASRFLRWWVVEPRRRSSEVELKADSCGAFQTDYCVRAWPAAKRVISEWGRTRKSPG